MQMRICIFSMCKYNPQIQTWSFCMYIGVSVQQNQIFEQIRPLHHLFWKKRWCEGGAKADTVFCKPYRPKKITACQWRNISFLCVNKKTQRTRRGDRTHHGVILKIRPKSYFHKGHRMSAQRNFDTPPKKLGCFWGGFTPPGRKQKMFSGGKVGCCPPILVNDNRTRIGGGGFDLPQIFGTAMNLLPICSTPRKMPQNAAKHHRTPQNTAEHRRTPQNSAECHKMPQNTAECHKMPQLIANLPRHKKNYVPQILFNSFTAKGTYMHPFFFSSFVKN